MRRGASRQHRGLHIFTVLIVAALAFASCADDADDDSGTPSTDGDSTETTSGELTDSFRGVTADAIKVGIVLVDYEAIKDFVDFHRGDQQAIAQTFVDSINENGGIGGRQIEPVFKTYKPIPGQEPSALTLCTSLTEDEEVFAVLGVFIDFTGDAQLCLTRDHETIHIGHQLEQPWIDDSPPALLVTIENTLESQAQALINLFEEEGTLEGRTVAVLADQDAEGRANDVITPGLEELGVEQGSAAILSITDTDTAAAQSQLDGFLERWESEGVDTIFMAGLRVAAAQFVEKIKAAMPDALLITDAEATLEQAQDQAGQGANPNPYAGLIGISGETESERWADKSPELQECVDIYEEGSGETVLGPDEVEPDADGRTAEIFIAVEDFCGELMMLKQVAEKAGPNLTNDTWREAVDGFGAIKLVTQSIASLCEGKYAAADGRRLVEYDGSIGETGNWSPLTEVRDVSGGQCS